MEVVSRPVFQSILRQGSMPSLSLAILLGDLSFSGCDVDFIALKENI